MPRITLYLSEDQYAQLARLNAAINAKVCQLVSEAKPAPIEATAALCFGAGLHDLTSAWYADEAARAQGAA